MRRTLVSYPLAVALALAVAACGAAEENGSAGAQGETLQDFIPGAFAFDAENAEEQFRQREREVQERIADCMAEQGFEYVPYVPNFEDQGFFGGAGSEEEFAAQYGMGITWDLLNQEHFDEENLPPDLANDPNYAIQQSLSPEESEAYFRALFGEEPDIDFESMTEEEIEAYFQDWQPSGCQNEAYESIFDQEASMTFYEEFGDQINDMYERARADPRIVELQNDWSECMAKAGYDFQEEQDAHIFILRRLQEVGAVSDLEIDPQGGFGYASAPMDPGSDAYRAAEAIMEEEITIAKASLECRGNVEDVYREVFAEYEREFIEANREALERFRDENQ